MARIPLTQGAPSKHLLISPHGSEQQHNTSREDTIQDLAGDRFDQLDLHLGTEINGLGERIDFRKEGIRVVVKAQNTQHIDTTCHQRTILEEPQRLRKGADLYRPETAAINGLIVKVLGFLSDQEYREGETRASLAIFYGEFLPLRQDTTPC